MKYTSVIPAQFISRPNRFIAHVSVEGKEEIVHVKNTGRCKELLIPGVTVYLEEAQTPQRKTKYDLVAVEKIGFGLINIDSQAPNRVVSEWLQSQNYSLIKPEYTFGESRIDFYMERDNTKYLMEVKGCTLEIDGIGCFPDAPTQRGVKHLRELIKAQQLGYVCSIAFVVQMEHIQEVKPNISTDPEFARAFYDAQKAGVSVLFLCCKVTPESLKITRTITSRSFQ